MRSSGPGQLEMLNRLRAVGARLALDDFGSGYSSLARFSQLAFHAVKLDRSFVMRMFDDPAAHSVVAAVIPMAAALGVDVVAEGIETPDHRAALVRLGCRHGQGFLFGRPQSADVIATALDSGATVLT